MKKAFNCPREIVISMSMLLLSFVFMSGSCDKDDPAPAVDTTYDIVANASGANEFPATPSTATGTMAGTYDITTNKLTYTIAWTGLVATPSALHFHGPALPGANASPVITLTINTAATTGGATGTVDLTEPQEADMLAGKWYWNVHNGTYPGGEIRGQLVATK